MIAWWGKFGIPALLTESIVVRLGKKVIECVVQQIGRDSLGAVWDEDGRP